jgi:hypothetical protein
VILYTSNGEVRQEFSIVLTARAFTEQPARWIVPPGTV